jgi:ADP-ribose pyrophosphatase YjhB (NUDIX family)
MKRLQQISGQVAFWLSWPLLFFYLRIGSRTRVVVVHGNEVLVVHNWHGDGKWSFPGGGLKRGEDPKHGAAREVMEETGVVVKPEKLQTILKGISKQRGLSYKYECFWTQVSTKPGYLSIN